MHIDVPIKIGLGASPTVGDLREAVQKLTKVPDGASVKFETVRGQRDAETTTLIVQGAALLED